MAALTEIVADSRHWDFLWEQYSLAPSIALCRVPEIEYASLLPVEPATLDHCCGDGLFAATAWPGQALTAGCDINASSLTGAESRGIYGRLDRCDVSTGLPYDTQYFDFVFDNSALEHVSDLDAALREVARVLKPGGEFAFNVLNDRYFEWWPLDERSKRAYREWQPFFHALTLEEWKQRLASVGLQTTEVKGYFDETASRELARLDFHFSRAFITGRTSALVKLYRAMPSLRAYWRRRLSRLTWSAPCDKGAGYSIRAVRVRA